MYFIVNQSTSRGIEALLRGGLSIGVARVREGGRDGRRSVLHSVVHCELSRDLCSDSCLFWGEFGVIGEYGQVFYLEE
ncbi:hypothetical protein RHGRI_005566 [Rhododendron griersonianum]|uniref:Uncharacterized protein n=1 Tax=Rhododendron griersonianum TaxID=479676 RepID=A0AAV6LEQ2_9ERIC|nr:hypothetical protein RHGRI_005566 [Rhododendron griersonianum]